MFLSHNRRLVIDQLESRRVLAGTADIVFVVDESSSQEHTKSGGNAVRPWVSGIVESLEEKLIARGIGNEGGAKNRYGMISMGFSGDVEAPDVAVSESDVIRPLTTNPWAGNDQFWADADEFDIFLAQFQNTGLSEDGWAGITEAVGADTIFSQNDGIYEFRSNAAVHFVVVSDESRAEAESQTQIGGLTSTGTSLFFEILEQLRSENIDTNGGPNILNDAIVTTVAPFDYDEFNILKVEDFANGDDLAASTVMGIDVHLLDGLNLDDRDKSASAINGDPTDFVSFTMAPTSVSVENATDFEFWTRAIREDDSSQLLDANVSDYGAIRSAFSNACPKGARNTSCGFGRYASELEDQDQTIVGQHELFESEDYAFLTWESRGTAWDFKLVQREFNSWDFQLVPDETYQGPGIDDDDPSTDDNEDLDTSGIPDLIEDWIAAIDDASNNFFGLDDMFDGDDDDVDADFLINHFNVAFVDDVFEKIKLQLGDLNRDGRVSILDIEDLTNNFGSLTAADLAYYDYDDDGNIDADDASKYVFNILRIWAGDANGDGIFDSADFVIVFEGGEFEDGIADNSTWSEGDWNFDFDFESSDFVVAFQQAGYADGESGRLTNGVDDDGDGQIDEFDEAFRVGFLPAWSRFVESVNDVYFPFFSDS